MAEYQDPDAAGLSVDEVEEEAIEYFAAAVPGWRGNAGSPVVLLIRAHAPLHVEQRWALAQRAGDEFDFFGEKVRGVQRVAPRPAETTVTFTARDAAGGYVVEEGTQLVIGGAAFVTAEEAEIFAGLSSVTGVRVVAAEPGSFANDLTGDVTIVSRQAWMEGATIEAATGLGDDGETPDEYRGRLVEEFRLSSLVPVTAARVSALARRVSGVARAVTLDGYDNALDTDGHARTFTVVAVAADGTTPSPSVLDEIVSSIEPLRGTNYTIFARGAWYTDVDADYTARALPGFDPADVKTAADAAVRAALDPARFAVPADVGDPSMPEMAEAPRTLVPIGEIYQAVEGVTGVDYCSQARLAVAGGTLANQSLNLTGRVALPRPATITGTVSAP